MRETFIPVSYHTAFSLLQSAFDVGGPTADQVAQLESLKEETLAQMVVSPSCVDFVRASWRKAGYENQRFAEDYFLGDIPIPTDEFAGFFDPDSGPDFEAEVLAKAVRLHLGDVVDLYLRGYNRDGDLDYFTELIWKSLYYAGQATDSTDQFWLSLRRTYARKGLAEWTKRLLAWIREYRSRFEPAAFESELAVLLYLDLFVMEERR